MKKRADGKSNIKTHQATLARFNSKLWHFHILVPSRVAGPLGQGGSRRVVCTINHTITFQCALMHDGDGGFFININAAIRNKLNLREGDTVTYTLSEDDSEYGLNMPIEFQELLHQDPEGDTLFQRLTPGKKRTLIYMVTTPKSADIRIRKGLCILNHLKATGGTINYKQLNELFKQSR